MIEINWEFYKEIIEKIYDGVYVVDTERKLLYWNKAAELISGYSYSDVVGHYCFDNILQHVNDEGCNLCQNGCPLSQTMKDGIPRKDMVYLHHKNGHRIPVFVRVNPIKDPVGNIVGAVEIFTDQTEQNEFISRAEEAKNQVYIDYLTGLPNRRYIEISLSGKMNEFQRYGWIFGIIFMDIDHFKNINDKFGHDVGDEVLRMVGRTFRSISRSFDMIGRWGGDEFMAIIPAVDLDKLMAVSNRFKFLIEKSVYAYKDQNIQATISLGATLIKSGDTSESLFARVDKLMYQSKDKGGNIVSIDE